MKLKKQYQKEEELVEEMVKQNIEMLGITQTEKK